MILAGLQANKLEKIVQTNVALQNSDVIPHISKILKLVDSPSKQTKQTNLIELSNLVKLSKIQLISQKKTAKVVVNNSVKSLHHSKQSSTNPKKFNFHIKSFVEQAKKLQIAGISFGEQFNEEINRQLIQVIQKNKLLEARFWGKINCRVKDYYVIQGYRQPIKENVKIGLGSQRQGQGVNYYLYYVTNNVFQGRWIELPIVSLQQVRASRQIKQVFSGNLEASIKSFPKFEGKQKHYLKCQLARITHSLQIQPTGIHKVHDENPRIIQYEEQINIPEFSELSTLQGWVHKNQMILNLGRCTHFVDPSLNEQQIQEITAELAEKDPEIERLRGIAEDKPEQQPEEGELASFWVQRTIGNTQIFPKQDKQCSYAVTTLKNIFWPGWLTIGYDNGFSNIYLGSGLKASQPCWNIFTNPDLQQDCQQVQQFGQPNPKQLPKVQQPEGEENQQGNENDEQN